MSNYDLLVVEDEDDIMELYRQITTAIKDTQLTSVSDGTSAIEKINNHRYDCIILDLSLPGANGIQVAGAVRNSNANRTTPTFIVSGHITPENRQRLKNFNIAEVISKPFSIVDMAQKIKATLSSRKKLAFYDSAVINVFLESAKAIIEHAFKESVLMGRPKVKPNTHPPRGYLTGTIPLKGQGFIGTLALSCNQAFANRIMESMLAGNDSVDRTDELAADSIAEICNQIAGKVKAMFAKKGQKITIGLPQVIIGANHRVYHKGESPVLYIPIGKEKMGCDLEFCFDKADITLEEQENSDYMSEGMILFD